jgi:Abnormal spindle-like microcephaly-assoc'd, ASPM-SPD-2-Hydin
VNPVATIHYILPPTLATGSPNTNVFLYGGNFVSGSVVQWNGQNLATTPNGGETSAGDELLSFTVPTNLLANTGTATIRVFNPGPAGGISDPISFDVSPPHPVVNYPASIDFGTILLGTTVTQTILLRNNGSGNYTASSVTIGSPYSVLSNTCTNVTFVVPGNSCNIQLQFSPVAAGSANTTLAVTDNGSGSPLHETLDGSSMTEQRNGAKDENMVEPGRVGIFSATENTQLKLLIFRHAKKTQKTAKLRQTGTHLERGFQLSVPRDKKGRHARCQQVRNIDTASCTITTASSNHWASSGRCSSIQECACCVRGKSRNSEP